MQVIEIPILSTYPSDNTGVVPPWLVNTNQDISIIEKSFREPYADDVFDGGEINADNP